MEATPQMGICVTWHSLKAVKRSLFIHREALPMNLHNNHEITRNSLVKQAATDKSHSSRGRRLQLKSPLLLISLRAPHKKGKESIFCNG